MATKKFALDLRGLRKSLDAQIEIAEQGIEQGREVLAEAKKDQDLDRVKATKLSLADATKALKGMRRARLNVRASCCHSSMDCSFSFRTSSKT